ncbi:hypothetical protein [Paenibacillus sp. PAMC21692]|uniref:hypothetical protein n=1 Tax=Paenibacillus sp. PAMC21692 TaxID=2762320 RepID=UPI00164D48E2|nr:hypothetical protein [Paenibacillus sp. PAMC21692]QNK58011.1 hypothetical protein H7F31_03360 [Paenibacillus sp. PAMC21692]
MHLKTNRYGKFVLDDKHTYTSTPLQAEEKNVVRAGAHILEPLEVLDDTIS